MFIVVKRCHARLRLAHVVCCFEYIFSTLGLVLTLYAQSTQAHLLAFSDRKFCILSHTSAERHRFAYSTDGIQNHDQQSHSSATIGESTLAICHVQGSLFYQPTLAMRKRLASVCYTPWLQCSSPMRVGARFGYSIKARKHLLCGGKVLLTHDA